MTTTKAATSIRLYARIAREKGLRDVDRAVYWSLIERGAARAPITSNARELASALGYSVTTIYASLRRLSAHDLITHQRAGRHYNAYQALVEGKPA